MKNNDILQKQLKMLSYIITHGTVTSYELSTLVNISERQVLKYVKDLRIAGFDIQSKTGINGGYYYNVSLCPVCNNKIQKNTK